MEKSFVHNPVAKALYLNALILAAILVVLLRRSGAPDFLPAALAQAQPSIAGGEGIFVMPAQFHTQIWGCYVLNTNTQTLCTYEYDPGHRLLTLTSARDLQYDYQLKDFATSPAPWEVKGDVEQEQKEQQARDVKPPAPPAAAH